MQDLLCNATWQSSWLRLSLIICSFHMSSTVLIYGSETWTLKRHEEERLERTEMRMIRWILGLTLRDKKRNDDICHILWVACITDKVREARLRWFGHVQRREEEDCVRRILEADVRGQRSRGKTEKRWIDVVKYNMEDLRVDLMNLKNRAEWRRRSKPAWRREREREISHEFGSVHFLKCLEQVQADQHNIYRVQQKSSPLKFFAVFSATVWNFNSKFYRFIDWNVLHLSTKRKL